MTSRFAAAMRRATCATRALNPLGATRLIQAALARNAASRIKLWSDHLTARHVEDVAAGHVEDVPSVHKRPHGAAAGPSRSSAQGTFGTRTFVCAAGARDYKLYVPVKGPKPVRGLIVMLQGCTQNPDDFAAGTGMNALADQHSLVIAYPAQTRAHNASGCWNWFRAKDQFRNKGEPAILAGIARELMAQFDLSRDQVFIAGLSAGGAMAVIMAETYPDVFSALGVHSGLPYQSANNTISALAAMRGRAGDRAKASSGPIEARPSMRTIIFHGSADKTVHPSNAKGIADDAMSGGAGLRESTEAGIANHKRFTRMVLHDADGHSIVENWSIEGAAHAWSGGSREGSFADPHGPDASSEMVRFFLERARTGQS